MRRLITYLIALLVALAAVSCGKEVTKPEEPKTAAEYLARAKESFPKNKKKALHNLNKAIALDESCVEARLLRTEIYESAYDRSERAKYAKRAIADYDKIIELEPDSPTCAERLRRRGVLKAGIGNHDEAIADFKESLAKDEEDPDTYEDLAEVYVEKDDREHAIECYGSAIQYDEENSCLYQARGRLFHENEELDKAIQDYEKAYELEPDAEPCLALAQIYREQGDSDKALEWYEKAREHDSSLDSRRSEW